MKKIGILALALVMAVGGLGAGFAHWSGTLDISGSVEMADLCVGWYQVTGGDPRPPTPNIDSVKNLDTGVVAPGTQDIGWSEYSFSTPVCTCDIPGWGTTDDIHYKTVTVILHDAYPGYYVDYQVHYHNCGLPVEIIAITPEYDPQLGFTFTDGLGDKLETCETAASSLEVWCLQPSGYGATDGVQPLGTYTFSVTIEFRQWQ